MLQLVLMVAGAVTLHRNRLARAERVAEHEWLTEEQDFWAALRAAPTR